MRFCSLSSSVMPSTSAGLREPLQFSAMYLVQSERDHHIQLLSYASLLQFQLFVKLLQAVLPPVELLQDQQLLVERQLTEVGHLQLPVETQLLMKLADWESLLGPLLSPLLPSLSPAAPNPILLQGGVAVLQPLLWGFLW
ncbi:hypothetical protein EYF80_003471 [Liparis tanakae]|uniref:Uncharacterized protein n=1 Tax=Liparis tanakae TaxID=230148 RepID=A0A4Z2J851_9TELE|nr:hypothetical protein EYF80_003471 [Liparis tanakae]